MIVGDGTYGRNGCCGRDGRNGTDDARMNDSCIVFMLILHGFCAYSALFLCLFCMAFVLTLYGFHSYFAWLSSFFRISLIPLPRIINSLSACSLCFISIAVGLILRLLYVPFAPCQNFSSSSGRSSSITRLSMMKFCRSGVFLPM